MCVCARDCVWRNYTPFKNHLGKQTRPALHINVCLKSNRRADVSALMASRENRNTFWSADRPRVLNSVGGISLRVWRRSKVTLSLFVRADDQQPHGSGRQRLFSPGCTWRTLSPVFLARRVCSAAFSTSAALRLSFLLPGPQKTQR